MAIAIAVATLVLLLSGSAAAGITFSGTYPIHYNPDQKRTATPTSATDNNAGINRTNCLNTQDGYQFAFTNVPVSGWTQMLVYARLDNSDYCTDQISGNVATHNCYRVAAFDYTDLLPGAKVVTISDAAIVAGISQQADLADQSNVDTATVCNPTASMSPTSFYLDFFLMNGGTIAGTPGTGNQFELLYQVQYDLRGPDPPLDISIGAGNHILIVHWSATSNGDPTNLGYAAYCYPAPGQILDAGPDGTTDETSTSTDSGTADSGVADTGADDTSADDTLPSDTAVDDSGAADDTSEDDTSGDDTTATEDVFTIPSGCPFTSAPVGFQPGQLPDPKYLCGSTGTGGDNIQISGLINGQQYAIALAGTDTWHNPGVLSDFVCDFPVETTDFYNAYRDAGGSAGGGYCNFGVGTGSVAGGVLLALLACTFVARRVRKERAR